MLERERERHTYVGPMMSCGCPFVAVMKWVMNSVLNTQDRTRSPSSESGPLRTCKESGSGCDSHRASSTKTYHPIVSKVGQGNTGDGGQVDLSIKRGDDLALLLVLDDDVHRTVRLQVTPVPQSVPSSGGWEGTNQNEVTWAGLAGPAELGDEELDARAEEDALGGGKRTRLAEHAAEGAAVRAGGDAEIVAQEAASADEGEAAALLAGGEEGVSVLAHLGVGEGGVVVPPEALDAGRARVLVTPVVAPGALDAAGHVVPVPVPHRLEREEL
jgi:hypothetical protein